MFYKRILEMIPLKLRIRAFYFFKMKSLPSLSSPQRYTELLQSRKLNMLTSYSELSDKLMVRKFVKRVIGDKYLIPLIGSYKSFDDICFNDLPESFVIKTNFGSGSGHIEIVKDKNTICTKSLKEKFDKAMLSSYKGAILGETQYDKIPKRILIEKFIEGEKNDIEDFKFHLFNDKDGFLQIDFDRFKAHKRNLYTLDYRRLDFDLMYKGGEYDLPPRVNLDRLKALAFKLAHGFDYVRVDLYLVKDQIYFGEMTFTPGNGFESFSTVEADLYYGRIWKQGS